MRARIAAAVVVLVGWLMSSMAVLAQNDDLVTMDFQAVELDRVVRFIAEMSGRNFVLDDKVDGRVTVVTPSPITKDEAFRLFEAVLEVHGFTLEPGDQVDKIVPISLAPTLGVPLNNNPVNNGSVNNGPPTVRGDNVEARLLHLHYVDASSVAATLKPLVSSWGNISANAPTNAIIITDSTRNIAKLAAMVASLDQPDAAFTQRTFTLQHADASQAEKIINAVFADYNKRRPNGLAGVAAFAETRSNLLIVTGPQEVFTTLEAMVERIDRSNSVSKDNFHIYYPENGSAEDIEKVLNTFIGKFKLNAPSMPAAFEKQVSIVSDASSNSLLISATQGDFELLLPLLKGLDIPRRQVFVEAIIVEVTDEKAEDYGVDWVTSFDSLEDGQGNVGGTNFGLIGGTQDPSGVPVLPGGLALGYLDSFVHPLTGDKVLSLAALVRLLETDSDANILSTPNLLVLENQPAEFAVGQNVPFVTGNQTNNGNVLQTIERKDVGLVLRVLPKILDGGRVKLEIYNEVSSIASTVVASGTGDGIVTNKRSIDTAVVLESGQTIVLGGLISEEVNQTVQKVPFLGSIPVLGYFFSSTSDTTVRRNLMVFLQPTIIENYGDLISISETKFNGSRNLWQKNQDNLTNSQRLPPRLQEVLER